MLFKKENNSFNKSKGFSKAALSFRIMIYLNYIYINIYIFKFNSFYIVEKRILNYIIYEIIKKFYS